MNQKWKDFNENINHAFNIGQKFSKKQLKDIEADMSTKADKIGFKYAFCSVNWNINDVNRILFQSQKEFDAWVNSKEAKFQKRSPFSPLEIDTTNITIGINLNQLPVGDINSAFNYNYCLIQIDNQVYGYFIVNADFTNVNNIVYQLKIDSFTSFFHTLSFNGLTAFIERQHVDRFKKEKDVNGNYFPDYSLSSPIHNVDSLASGIRPVLNLFSEDITLAPPFWRTFNVDNQSTGQELDFRYFFNAFGSAIYNQANNSYSLYKGEKTMYAYAVLAGSEKSQLNWGIAPLTFSPIENLNPEEPADKSKYDYIGNLRYFNNYAILTAAKYPTSGIWTDKHNADNYMRPYVRKIFVTNYPLWTSWDITGQGPLLTSMEYTTGGADVGISIGVIPFNFTNTTEELSTWFPIYLREQEEAYKLRVTDYFNKIKPLISKEAIIPTPLIDPKVYSQEFINFSINDLNKQSLLIHHNLLLTDLDSNNDSLLTFDLKLGSDGNETFSYLKFNEKNVKNRLIFQTMWGERGLLTSNTGGLPSFTDAWNNFIVNNGNAYATAKQNINRSFKVGLATSILGTAVGLAAGGGEIALAGKEIGAANRSFSHYLASDGNETNKEFIKNIRSHSKNINSNKATIFAGANQIVNSATGSLGKIGGAIINRKNQLANLSAQQADLRNQPETINLQGYSTATSNMLMLNQKKTTDPSSHYGSYKLLVATPTIQQMMQLDNHFFKNGYVVNRNITIGDIGFFQTRKIFNYWRIKDIMSCVDKSVSPLNHQVYQDIENLFAAGAMLWHEEYYINDFTHGNKELWMNDE